MIINWYGHSCFKIANQGGHLIIIIDPFDKGVGLNPPKGNADIIAVSRNHKDHNNIKAMSGEPFIINGPGEYEVKNIRIIGVSSFQNTIYLIETDGIRICHLGDLRQERLTDRQLEAIGQVDVLMAPVGGGETIGAKEAAKISKQIEPQIIIPMRYKLPGLKENLAGVDEFLKEMGLEEKTAVDKLTLKKKDFTNGGMEVVVMKI
ncbi:MAG: MBL fold metallo-hydrolase [Candidatus Portnoybacteria bacterium]|nr:MBL fold metallo-hydrolase [Candidatus Portnoybacteria bacterium]